MRYKYEIIGSALMASVFVPDTLAGSVAALAALVFFAVVAGIHIGAGD